MLPFRRSILFRPTLFLSAILPLLLVMQCSQPDQVTQSATGEILSANQSSSTIARASSEAQPDSNKKRKTASRKPQQIAEFMPSSNGDDNRGNNIHADYQWTTNHMHIGVRWQPYGGRPKNNAYDATRPIISKYSSYAQFWVAWSASEPSEQSTDYAKHMSDYLKTIEQSVDACVAKGLKCEFVFWHCPAWAAVGGEAGGVMAKEGYYPAFVERIAKHFKGRVHAYQLAHEANLKMHLNDGDMDYMISEVFTKGAKAIRKVYAEAPASPVIISTSGCSPCFGCDTVDGLNATGGLAINNFYDQLIASSEMMQEIDALNLNISDQNDGYGTVDGAYVASVWGNYDLARKKLDDYGHRGKAVMASESWITWDDTHNSADVNGDGSRNELDAYLRAITIMGKCLQRGLNTMNFPWSDNSSSWSMGLTKRHDYNGRVKELMPEIVIPSKHGGADIVTSKVVVRGNDDEFEVALMDEKLQFPFTIEDYIDPSDPNHLHYYVWRWYAQISGGNDEVIRHAVAGEAGNNIGVFGPDFTGPERYRISSYNRTRNSFMLLIYASGATAKHWVKVAMPATIQNGRHYNNELSQQDYRGEGFKDGDSYQARIITKNISPKDGSDIDPSVTESEVLTVANGMLQIPVMKMNKFTAIEFVRVEVKDEDQQ
ncbi:MAG: hypothetical protein P8P36_01475 [Akkermansiaceae bacterium]|nr:hypothetical protein [Akkermansiaceae bacterium]